jgi:phosphopantetheinyl transferase
MVRQITPSSAKSDILSCPNDAAFVFVRPATGRENRIHYLKAHGIEVEHDDAGKPLVASPEGYWISITHTENIDITLLAKTPCGIDIERLDRKISPSLAKRLHPSCDEKIDNTVPDDPVYAWIALEAYHKLTAIPLLKLLKNPSMRPTPVHTYHLALPEHVACMIFESPIENFHVLGDVPLDCHVV